MNIKNPKTTKMIFMVGGGVLVFLLIILAIVLATRGDKEGPITPQTQTASGKVELEYWGLWEPESVMEPLIQEYEAINEHVTIKYAQRSFNEYENTLYTRLQQGKTGETPAPDIVKINNSWLYKFETLLSPLPQNIMSPSDYAQTFYPTCVADFTGLSGEIYAIPIGIDGLALFYNKVLLSQEGLSEPPQDWDGIIELAKKLTKKDSSGRITQAGLAMGTVNNVSHSADIFSFLLLQNNIEVAKVEGGFLKVDFDNQQSKSALSFYRSFAQEHEVWSSDLPLDLDMFFRGELAMFFAPSWRVFDIIEAAPAIEFDIIPLPQLQANDPVYYSMYWGESVSASSAHKEEAWKFLKFLSEKENMQKFHANGSAIRAFGQPYSRMDLESDLINSRYVGKIMEMASEMKTWRMSQNSTVEEYINLAIADNDLGIAEENINTFLSGL